MQANGQDCGPWVLYFLEQRLYKSSDFIVDLENLNHIECAKLIKDYRKELPFRMHIYKLNLDIALLERNMKFAEEDGDSELYNTIDSR